MLKMTTDVVTDLKTTFTAFKERGLSKIQRDNVSIINNHLEAVTIILNGVD